MTNLVGIDLGTTYSAIAWLDPTGRLEIINNSDGENITASVVFFEKANKVIVGKRAMKFLGASSLPESSTTFGRFKREMGEETEYIAFEQKYNPTTLSSFVLKRLKDDAEQVIGEIKEAVVTIPANFANEAREATLEAAKVAGLKIKNIINEPTAAALYYAFIDGNVDDRVYAIYDLGGGTFDISIIRVKGRNIEVINSDGVPRLGGDDFDEKLIEIINNKFQEQTGECLQKEITKLEAEEYKKDLTPREIISHRGASSKGGEKIEVTKEEFEDAISTLIVQAEMVCENVLDEANFTTNDIDEVILVGGSTRMPIVQRSVEKVFKKAPIILNRPDEAVALGAALYVAYNANPSDLNPLQKKAIAQMNVSDAATKYYGVTIMHWDSEANEYRLVNDSLIKKREKLPCSITKTYQTMFDNQTAVKCVVTESSAEETDPDFVKKIWEGNLGDLPPGRPAGQKVQVTFSYDENQTMKCSFLDVNSQKKREVDFHFDNENIKAKIDIDEFKVE